MSANNAANAEEVVQDPIAESAEEPQTSVAEGGRPKLELIVSESEEESSAQQPVGSVQAARFSPLTEIPVTMGQGSMDLLLDVDLDLSVELGRASVPVREILQLGSGSIVELNKLAGDSVDVLVNGRLIARGEVVVVDENFGVRITEIVSPAERLNRLS